MAYYWGAVALICLALAPLAPELTAGLPGCPVKSISGLPCPSCGATRATLALADLSPGAALAANPGVTLGWIAFLLGGLVALALAIVGGPFPRLPKRLPVTVRVGTVALLAANWFYLFKAGI